MRPFLIILTAWLCLSGLSACGTTAPLILPLDGVRGHKDVINLTMQDTESGLIILENVKVNGVVLPFLLDTGATHSAIFEDRFEALNVGPSKKSTTTVHGMIQSQERDVLNVERFEVGQLLMLDRPLVVLTERERKSKGNQSIAGIIGMDILSKYQLLITPSERSVRLIPSDLTVIMPPSWDRINLIKNPYQDDQRRLRFMEVRIVGALTPALLDTGAEFSVMNWKSAQFTQVRAIRKGLRKTWELDGAVGTFQPTTKVRMELFRGGQKVWKNKDFVVMDFDSLDVLGIKDKPFVIGGINLFKGETFFIDFERNYVAVESAD